MYAPGSHCLQPEKIPEIQNKEGEIRGRATGPVSLPKKAVTGAK